MLNIATTQCPQCGDQVEHLAQLNGYKIFACTVCLTEYECPECHDPVCLFLLRDHLDNHFWDPSLALAHVRELYKETSCA